MSTPVLWAEMSISYPRADGFERSSLKRAKSCPLDVTLHISGGYNASISGLDKFLTTFLITPANQIKALRVQPNGDHETRRLKELLKSVPFTRLQHLEFADGRKAYSTRGFIDRNLPFPQKAPLLKSLTLDRTVIDVRDKLLPQLRILNILHTLRSETMSPRHVNEGFPAYKIARMLHQAPNLEELRFRGMGNSFVEFLENDAGWTDIVTLSKLRSLHLVQVDIVLVNKVLNNIDAPCLEEVAISQPVIPERVKNQHEVVATKAFPHVRSLELGIGSNGGNHNTEYHIALCKWFPDITTLILPVAYYRRLWLWIDNSPWPDLTNLTLLRPQPETDTQTLWDVETDDEKGGGRGSPRRELDHEAVAMTVLHFLLARIKVGGMSPLQTLEMPTKLRLDHPLIEELTGLMEE